jgi:hypothetical protein
LFNVFAFVLGQEYLKLKQTHCQDINGALLLANSWQITQKERRDLNGTLRCIKQKFCLGMLILCLTNGHMRILLDQGGGLFGTYTIFAR